MCLYFSQSPQSLRIHESAAGGLPFLSFIGKLRKKKNPRNPVNPVREKGKIISVASAVNYEI